LVGGRAEQRGDLLIDSLDLDGGSAAGGAVVARRNGEDRRGSGVGDEEHAVRAEGEGADRLEAGRALAHAGGVGGTDEGGKAECKRRSREMTEGQFHGGKGGD
jgi:hypothetical protein